MESNIPEAVFLRRGNSPRPHLAYLEDAIRPDTPVGEKEAMCGSYGAYDPEYDGRLVCLACLRVYARKLVEEKLRMEFPYL